MKKLGETNEVGPLQESKTAAANSKAQTVDTNTSAKPSVAYTGTPTDVGSLLDAMMTRWRKSAVRISLREETCWNDKQIESVFAMPASAVEIQRAARMIVLEITVAVLTLLMDRASDEQGALKLALELCGLQFPENAAENKMQTPEAQMDQLERAMLDNFREVLGMPPKPIPSPTNRV